MSSQNVILLFYINELLLQSLQEEVENLMTKLRQQERRLSQQEQDYEEKVCFYCDYTHYLQFYA